MEPYGIETWIREDGGDVKLQTKPESAKLFFHSQRQCAGGVQTQYITIGQKAARNEGYIIIGSIGIGAALLLCTCCVWKFCKNRKIKNQEELASRLVKLETEESEEKDKPVNFMFEEKGGPLLNATNNNTTTRSSGLLE